MGRGSEREPGTACWRCLAGLDVFLRTELIHSAGGGQLATARPKVRDHAQPQPELEGEGFFPGQR